MPVVLFVNDFNITYLVYNFLIHINLFPNKCIISRGADKFLDRPTSRSHRTESIVSLERGVCSCAELQVSSRYRG